MRGSEAAAGRGLLGPRIVAVVLVVLGALLVLSALGIARGGGYSVIGPATIPLTVAVGLLLLGLAFALRTTLLPDRELATLAAGEEAATHWPTVGLVAVALIAYALLLDGVTLGPVRVPGLGYVLATGLFLPATARILGSRSPLRDLAGGLGLAILVYVGFTEFLGVRLPAGILGLFL